MAQKARDTVLGEVQQRLIQLGLPQDVRRGVLTLVQHGFAREASGEPSEVQFPVLVARTYYKTAQRAAEALGSSSFSMLTMLLDLFIAHEQDRPISITSLCIASGAATTTALRQIGQLEERGFVTRHEDGVDRRRWWVRPTPRALDLVRSIVDEWTMVLCG